MKERANWDKETADRYNQELDRCLGLAVQEFRTANGLSQGELAKAANMSVRWLKKLEGNQLTTAYSIRRIDRIACALGVPIYDLFKRATEMAGPLPPWLDQEGAEGDE
jgi:transcriptional regulator with XRE-family HTH domain